MTFLHPANIEELINIAKETGAEVIRGPLRYPSETDSWQPGADEALEHIVAYADHRRSLRQPVSHR